MPSNQRVQVESSLRAPINRPVASPVDAFAHTGPNKLEQLAQSLAQVVPQVAQFSNVLADRTADAEYQKGVTARRKAAEQGRTLAEAQRRGEIPAQENPWFMAGLQEQDGRVSADTWHTDLQVALAKNEQLQKSTSLADFDQFVNLDREAWLKDHVGDDGRTSHFELGFGHRSDAYLDEERRRFASEIEKRLANKSDDFNFQEIKTHVRESLGKAEMGQIGADIDALNNAGIAQGRDKSATNKSAVDAIAAAALEFEDPATGEKALDLLKYVNAGSGKVGDTKYGSKVFEETKKKLQDSAWQKNQRDWSIAEQQRTMKTRELLSTAVSTLRQDPHADLAPLVAQASDMPDVVADLVGLQRNTNYLQFRTDESVKKDLYSRIWTTGDVSERSIVQRLSAGSLTTQDADWLIDQLKSSKDAGQKGVFDDFNFRQELSNIHSRFSDPLGRMGGTDADRAAQAEAVFRQSWFELNNSGAAAKMSPADKITWLSDHANSVVTQQRGPDALKITNAPAPPLKTPEAVTKVLPKNLVVTEQDLRDALAGDLSPAIEKQLKTLGLTQPSEIAAFLFNQIEHFSKKTGREPQKGQK